jgi:hypothetical protein
MKKNFVIPVVLLLITFFSNAALAGHWVAPFVSPTLMHIAGTLKIDGAHAQINDEVAVFDSTGKLVGSFVVDTAGIYGDVPINGDVASTLTVNEGSPADGVLNIKVWSAGKSKEYSGGEISVAGASVGEPYRVPAIPLTFSASGFFGVAISANAAR